MKFILAALFALPTAAAADGYSGHKGVSMYRDKPCTVVIAAIDGDATLGTIATQGMAWGFLLGYDTANGGLHGTEDTTLIRLRKACAQSPKTPALDLLEGFKK